MPGKIEDYAGVGDLQTAALQLLVGRPPLGHRSPERAEELFHRLLTPRNDVGLLSEEYDTRAATLVGDFPQALTHLALVNRSLEHSKRG